MLTGCTVSTDRSKHTAQQIKLVRDERINLSEVAAVRIQFFINAIIEQNQVLNDGLFIIIVEEQGLIGRLCFLQNSLTDNFINIGRGQGQSGIKTTLNLREVVALSFGDGVNILLAGDDDPRFTLAGGSQIFGYCLKVQHQLGIVTDVLTDFVNKENHMMIVSLTVDVSLNQIGKAFDADGILSGCSFTPVTSSFFTHKVHISQHFNNVVLDKVKIISRFCPFRSERILKLFFELLIATFFGKFSFQVSQERDSSTEALHFIEHFQENRNDGILVLLATLFTLRVDVEQNYIGRNRCSQSHVSKNHAVFDFRIFLKVLKRSLAIYGFVLQQIREDFQEVRFTASKETGNPNTHLIGVTGNATLIAIEEITEVFL